MNVLFLLVTCTYFASWVETARILGVFPVPQYSHYILGGRLMKALAEKGHDVTIITPFREKDPPKNYKEVFLEGAVEEEAARRKGVFHMRAKSLLPMIFRAGIPGIDTTEKTMSNPGIQNLMTDPNEHFDLVIVEQFLNDVFKGFAYHFKAPLVAISSTGSGPWLNGLLGNPSLNSYIPGISKSYTTKMDFWERLHNGLSTLTHNINRYLHYYPKMNEVLQKHFPGSPPLEELNKNISLVLLNSHVSSNHPVPHVPNMIEIGGFHVYPPKKLPEDLQEYLDSAEEGVIYFSMGSNQQSRYFPEEKRKSFIEAFSQLNVKILWKFEDENLPGMPPNVKLKKWLPQQDVLAHPNVKLFITHGGLLSTIETIYHGVPILGIPMAGDQHLNMAHAASLGIGEVLDYNYLTKDTLLAKMRKILQDPRYTENVKRRSFIMKDRPIPPLEEAVFWVEYVIRHRGATHFKSAALDMTWYQIYMLDVITFVGVVCIGVFVILYFTVLKICRRSANRNRKFCKKKTR